MTRGLRGEWAQDGDTASGRRIALLMCDVQLAGGIHYCMRKDKVMQLKARAEMPFAKGTIGQGRDAAV